MKTLAVIGSGLIFFACGTAAAQNAVVPNHESSIAAPSEWSKNFTVSDPAISTENALSNVASWIEKAQTFQFGGNGRWNLNVNVVTRPVESPLPREEMRAGATYQFTPRFSLGGSLSVGANELDDVSQWKEQEVEAGVRLKTTFKF